MKCFIGKFLPGEQSITIIDKESFIIVCIPPPKNNLLKHCSMQGCV